jgi:hypothetical protein
MRFFHSLGEIQRGDAFDDARFLGDSQRIAGDSSKLIQEPHSSGDFVWSRDERHQHNKHIFLTDGRVQW